MKRWMEEKRKEMQLESQGMEGKERQRLDEIFWPGYCLEFGRNGDLMNSEELGALAGRM